MAAFERGGCEAVADSAAAMGVLLMAWVYAG